MTNPLWEDPFVTQLIGDCRVVLDELPAESVDCCITSPPYWSLRRYEGNQELVWDDPGNCEHRWINNITKGEIRAKSGIPHMGNTYDLRNSGLLSKVEYNQPFCSVCGAWQGALGLEPTIELYIKHLLEVFEKVKRVLKSTATCFINIGDSYFTDNPGSGEWTGPAALAGNGEQKKKGMTRVGGKHSILKPKDMCLIPQRLAIALQEAGWYVRSIPIWGKLNPMPESVSGWRWERHKVKVGNKGRGKERFRAAIGGQDHAPNGSFQSDAIWQDCPGCPKCSPNNGYVLRKGSWRPTSSYEEILMLAKTDEYFGDGEEVREQPTDENWTHRLEVYKQKHPEIHTGMQSPEEGVRRFGTTTATRYSNPSGRNLRDVWTFPTEGFGLEMCQSCKRVYEAASFRRLPETKGSRKCRCAGDNKDYLPDWQPVMVEVEWESQGITEAYESKYKKADTGQSPRGFTRSQTIAKQRQQSRQDALRLFPDKPQRQQEYINYIHDHHYPPSWAEEVGNSPLIAHALISFTTEQGQQCQLCGEIYTPAEFAQLPQARVKVCRCGESEWLSHFATFPQRLPAICILSSTSEKGCCRNCGAPWARISQVSYDIDKSGGRGSKERPDTGLVYLDKLPRLSKQSQTLGWLPVCKCGIEEVSPALVLDPFSGSGTVGVVSKMLGRRSILIDLSKDYGILARARIEAVNLPLC